MITLQQFRDISKECGFDSYANFVTSNNCVGVTWTVCSYWESDSTIEFRGGPYSYPGGFCYSGRNEEVIDVKKCTLEQFREFLSKRKQIEKDYIKEFRHKKIEEL